MQGEGPLKNLVAGLGLCAGSGLCLERLMGD
jgi:hypothetical protein